MTEHCAGFEHPLSALVDARGCVTLPAIPAVYGLHHPEDGVTAWVFALPGGLAVIVPSGDGTGVIHTSLDLVERHWAPLRDAQLVPVARLTRGVPRPRHTEPSQKEEPDDSQSRLPVQ